MRTVTLLNGTWDFIADLDPKYHDPDDASRIPAYAKPEISRRFWRKVPVPGVWQHYAERYDLFEGVCWFSREFQIGETDRLDAARLRFGAVNYKCDIYVNGKLAGAHETGYTEFSVDIGEFIRSGTNHMAVRVDNRATSTVWPACLGYFNYGGIHRDVVLELHYGPSLREPKLLSRNTEQGWMLQVSGQCSGGRSDSSVTIACNNRQQSGSLDHDGAYAVQLLLPDVDAWTPEHPVLYSVEIALEDQAELQDRYETMFGFREIRVADRNIVLNGAPYPLKGICYVYDNPTSGMVFTTERMREDVRAMKELGCNTVRCHYAMDRKFYDMCDREGLLVWIEPNIYCYHPSAQQTGTAFADPHAVGLAERMIREMIRPALNHPCVAIYGIGNECNASHPEAEPFFQNLIHIAREADSSRIISYAALYGNVGPLAGMIDVLGINSYWGWYDRIYTAGPLTEATFRESGVRPSPEPPAIDLTAMRDMLDKVIRNSHENLVLLLTEFGADSVPGYISQGQDLWSENYHAALLTEIFALSSKYPQIAGTFPFCFSDYRDPSKESNGYWNEHNLKGVVSYDRRRKLSFSAVQQWYKR